MKGKPKAFYDCQNPACAYTFLVREGMIMTAEVKQHCGMPMIHREPTAEERQIDEMLQEKAEKTNIKLEWEQIGARLKELREQKGMDLSRVSKFLGELLAGKEEHYSSQIVQFWERGWPVPSPVIIALSGLYEVSIAFILSGPLPYKTDEEWIAAFIRAEVSEGTLASEGLHCDRLEARTRVEQFRQRREAALTEITQIAQEMGEYD